MCKRHKAWLGDKHMKSLLIGLVLSVLFSISASGDPLLEKWDFRSGGCHSDLYRQPNGPFAVVLFCEDALGAYLAVVYIEPIGSPATENGRWKLNDRYWHDDLWGSDVTGFRWAKDGKYLFVSTSRIYGSGGFFELSLEMRTAKQRMPKRGLVSESDPGPGYDISGSILKELR